LLIAGAFLIAAALFAFLYLWSPHATLRVAIGTLGGNAHKLLSAFVSATTAAHPCIRFETVPVADLEASSKAMEEGRVDIAIVRSDVTPPVNGQTLVILRRDIIAIVLPPDSPVKTLADLSGKTIGIPEGRLQEYNSRALDTILGYYNIAPATVQRAYLPIPEIGRAIRRHRLARPWRLAPSAPATPWTLWLRLRKATKGTPMAIDESETIAKQFPGFETIDAPEGCLRAHPPIPDDTLKTLAVTYRLVAPITMLNVVAGAIGRSILRTKSKLMALTPAASQIEAPDPANDNPLLPVHPGVAAYLASGDESFFEAVQRYFYVLGITLSLMGSMIAIVAGRLRDRRLAGDQQRIFRFLVIADEAIKANSAELEALEREFVRWSSLA
jgi:TRAP-type uncharacterized transport system substrate-binding protein